MAKQPGDVRRRGRQRAGHPASALRPRPGRTTPTSGFARSSSSGSGSPCSSRTSPRPWPRGAARRRPPRCAMRTTTSAPHPRRTATRVPVPQGLTDGRRDRGRVGAQARRRGARAGRGLIPADGEIVEGVASVDESAITGESAPVVREAGGDRSAVTGGTRVASDWLKIEVAQDPGGGFVDRMIALVEGSSSGRRPPTRSRSPSSSRASR
jgi:hypothetical protein